MVCHHPRVRIEKTDYFICNSKNQLGSDCKDSAKVNEPSDMPAQLKYKIINNRVAPKPPIKIISQVNPPISNPVLWKYKNTITTKLKKSYQIKDRKDSLLGMLGLLVSIGVGFVGLLLIVAGLIMGLFNILIGFWITWIIGVLAILFSLILSIYISTFGYDDLFSGIFVTAYSILFILAIVFLLIVLL